MNYIMKFIELYNKADNLLLLYFCSIQNKKTI